MLKIILILLCTIKISKSLLSQGLNVLKLNRTFKDSDCMPNSVAYNGTCIYFSNQNQKLSWIQAEKFCRSIPLNTSLLVIENQHQLEFIRRKLIQIKEIENSIDQIAFISGFYKHYNQWKWINWTYQPRNSNLLNDYFLHQNESNGGCGVVALDRNFKIIMKSFSCSAPTRFSCVYDINPCYNNNACGSNGKCINLGREFYCDCESVSIFYTGRYCNKFNLRAYQSFLALGLVLLIMILSKKNISRIKNSKSCNLIKKTFFKKSNNLKDKNSIEDQSEPQKPRLLRTLTRTASNIYRENKNNKNEKNLKLAFAYCCIFFSIIGLTVLLIILADLNNNNLIQFRKNVRENNSFVNYVCNKFERNYLIEELFYLSFSSVFLFYLVLFKKNKRRFGYYISQKFQNHQLLLNLPKSESDSKRLSPSYSFSILNRAQSAAVYIIYTYDILNIFLFLYISDSNASFVPFYEKLSGVLFDLLFQMIQVFLIGIKFLPILIVIDLNASRLVYFFTFLYIFLIWLVKCFSRTFCSQTKTIIIHSARRLINYISHKIESNLELQLQISSVFSGYLSDELSLDKKYQTILTRVVPKLFKEKFQLDELVNDETKSRNQFIDNNNLTRYSNKFKSKIDKYEDVTLGSNMVYELFYYVPFYFTISYLLVKYLLSFLLIIFEPIKEHIQNNDDNQKELNKFFSENYKNLSKQLSVMSKAVDTDILVGKNFVIENHNYAYIKRKFSLRESESSIEELEEKKLRKKLELKFSRHYCNTYTVAFMIVYFFTIFSLKFSSITNELLHKIFILIDLYVYNISDLIEEINFYKQLTFACVFTSVWVIIQMILSINHFLNDLIRFHNGDDKWSKIIYKYNHDYYEKVVRLRNNIGSKVTSDSLHFSGYLIAHLVYGYFIIYIGFLFVLLLLKFFYYYPRILYSLFQIVFPVVVLFVFKTFILQLLSDSLFSRTRKENSYRIQHSNFYNVLSYFNFFFDCFIGILACFGRIGISNLISLFHFHRIDLSVYNKSNDFVLKFNDKGYLAYLNYVRMEHWYNNPVVSGFCEMLIEEMLTSKVQLKSIEKSNHENRFFNHSKYKSRKRLRNIFYLCIIMHVTKLENLKKQRWHSVLAETKDIKSKRDSLKIDLETLDKIYNIVNTNIKKTIF